jgi:hypothetical protein
MKGGKISIVELRVPFVVTGAEENSPKKTALQPKDIITNSTELLLNILMNYWL